MRFIVRGSLTRFLKEPISVRNAMRAIIVVMLVNIVLGGILIRIVDPTDFSNIGVGMWWALQTITTVGYGDVTPTTPLGRIVGAVVMLSSLAFLSVVTAGITSTFVERARAQHRSQELAIESDEDRQIAVRLAE